MNFSHLFLFVFLAFPALAFAQHGKTKPDGGGCGYHYTHSPAIVYFIHPEMNNVSDIFFIVNTDYGTDTLTYRSMNNRNVPNDTIRKYNIKRGDVSTYEEGRIYSGSCSPRIVQIKLVKYVPDKKAEECKIPCTASKHISPAPILAITPVDSTSSDITFCIYGQFSIDTVSYFEVNHSYIATAEIIANNFKPGDMLTYEEEFGLSKNCAVFYREIILTEKHERKKH
ncbi:MAG: hypothetical protein M3R17_14760 [Bacteroidota bacterium]|nr:hypothetical protein [Bacteroidota bacterium]